MIQHGTRLATETSFYSNQVNFYLAEYRMGKPHVAKVEYAEESNPGLPYGPSFSLPMETAQEFFEMLWSQGFRSKHDRGSADRLDAARAEHIADLRRAAKLEQK